MSNENTAAQTEATAAPISKTPLVQVNLPGPVARSIPRDREELVKVGIAAGVAGLIGALIAS